MKENEAKVKAAQKRLQDIIKKETEEENDARREAAQKVFKSFR